MSFMTEIHGYIILTSTRYASGSSSTAIPLWMNRHPSGEADTSVALFESGGSGVMYDYQGISFERPTVQVVARSSSYVIARDNAEHIFSLLGSVTNQVIAKTTAGGTTPYLTVTPIQSPSEMGQDAERRTLITCNFQAEKEVS